VDSYIINVTNMYGVEISEDTVDSLSEVVFLAEQIASPTDTVTIYEGTVDASGSLSKSLIVMQFTQDALKNYDRA